MKKCWLYRSKIAYNNFKKSKLFENVEGWRNGKAQNQRKKGSIYAARQGIMASNNNAKPHRKKNVRRVFRIYSDIVESHNLPSCCIYITDYISWHTIPMLELSCSHSIVASYTCILQHIFHCKIYFVMLLTSFWQAVWLFQLHYILNAWL